MPENADFSRQNLELASDIIARRPDIRDEYLLGQPFYMDAANYLVDVLEIVLPADARILEVSCGTGILAELILRRLPGVRLDVSDVSRETLEVVQRRTKRHAKRIRFIKKDNATYSFTGSYDGIVTSNAMRLTFVDYERLYRNFHRILKRNGIVLIAEADVVRRKKSFLADSGNCLNDVKTKAGSYRRWQAFGSSKPFTARVDTADIRKVVRYYSPSFHTGKLDAAGFEEGAMIYKKYHHVIIAGMKGKLSFTKDPA